MPWFRVDDQFAQSKKVLGIPRRDRPMALGLWMLVGTWCAQQLTDGHFSGELIAEFGGTARAVAHLQRVGLWHSTGHDCVTCPQPEVSGGLIFHDWPEYQPSRSQVLSERAAARERMARARARRKGGQPATPDGSAEVRANVGRSSGEVRLTPTRPDPTVVPTELPKTTAPRGARIPEGFAASDGMREWAAGHTPLVDIDRETENFRDYWAGVAGAKGTKLDWPATWRTWMRRAQTDAENRGQRAKPLHAVGQIDLNPWRSR